MSQEINSNVPASAPTSWLQTWITAVTKPNEQTFAELVQQPGAGANKAYLWVFIAALIYFVSVIVQLIVISAGFGDQGAAFGQVLGGEVAVLLCAAPFAAALSVLSFMITVALIQWVAKMFSGTGTYDKLAYAVGAITAPVMLVSAVLSIPAAIPSVGFLFGLAGFAVAIYALVLEVMAVKGVNGFGWGPAIGSVLIPPIALGLIVACIVIAILILLGPAIGDVFSQIISELGGY